MPDELTRQPVWHPVGPYLVTSELFLDLVLTSECSCSCPFCIARTNDYAVPDDARWQRTLAEALRRFDVRSIILLGGEATQDPCFWPKVDMLSALLRERPVERLILTTNGLMLRSPAFMQRLLASPINAVNLSYMHHEQAVNDAIFGAHTLTVQELRQLWAALRGAGKTLRLNVNVYRGSIGTVEDMEAFVYCMAGCCDAIKFSPLMATDMFDTRPEVTAFTARHAMPDEEIRVLYDAFCARHTVLRRAANVLGFVDYTELDVQGQRVILKYAQVEDKYDRSRYIPTLKLYPNGCLSNAWDHHKNLLDTL